MKFVFDNITPPLSLSGAIDYLLKNGVANYKDISIQLPSFYEEPDAGLILVYKQVVLFIPFRNLSLVLKRLHYFVHHKWLYSDEVTGFVHCLTIYK